MLENYHLPTLKQTRFNIYLYVVNPC